MKLLGSIELHVPGERVLRQPNFWDKMKKRFGGEPDLRTDQMRAALEAAALVDATREAFNRLGAKNAVSLVVDDQVLFQDKDGKPDDLGDLFLAFHENESVFGKEFRLLRLAIEHDEAGLHLLIEIVARGVHPENEAAARIVVSARIVDFEPKPGEDAEAYRRRVEPLTTNATIYESHRRQFDNFVERVADAMRMAMPEARVEVRSADAMIVRPTDQVERARQPEPPTSPRYDPYDVYYPNPYGGMLSALMWTSIFSMAIPPQVVVINQQGEALGSPHDVGPEIDHGNTDYGAEGDGGDHGDGGDADMGGDMDGGDMGGGDFGGGDW